MSRDSLLCPKCDASPCICPSEGDSSSDNSNAPEEKKDTGKIIFLCGTSTAGKTSICSELQKTGDESGRQWIIDGADLAQDSAWTQSSGSWPSGEVHFTKAIKRYIKDDAMVDRAVSVFGARTLTIALLSRGCLGNPEVDNVNLVPSTDIKEQAKEVHASLCKANQDKYKIDDIEALLHIIQTCPETEEFKKQNYHPALDDFTELMLERAIDNARAGKTTVLDIVGNEHINDENIADVCREKLISTQLPEDTQVVTIAHCPVDTLIGRIEARNKNAEAENRKDDIRQSFFPFVQYGMLYEKAPEKPDPTRPVIGFVSKLDIQKAAQQYASSRFRNEQAGALINNLGFESEEGEEVKIAVVAKAQYDVTFQTGIMSSADIAQELCATVFGSHSSSTASDEDTPTLSM